MQKPNGVHLTDFEWELVRPLIQEIEELKAEKDALILAHNYQRSELYHSVADVRGDSLALAVAATTHAKRGPIVVCGVHFMAETAKIMNPDRVVLSPDPSAGCSLADSISADDMRHLRQSNPNIPIVVYVNTSAEVKALADACCTSSNAARVVNSFEEDTVIVAPDQHLADWVRSQTTKTILTWDGSCEVHRLFTTSDVAELRQMHPDTHVLVHPECEVSVQESADFVGSTSQLADYIERNRPQKVSLLTECTMSDNLRSGYPQTSFVQPCSLCPHMRKITLESVRDSLKHGFGEVHVDPDVSRRARRSLEYMVRVG